LNIDCVRNNTVGDRGRTIEYINISFYNIYLMTREGTPTMSNGTAPGGSGFEAPLPDAPPQEILLEEIMADEVLLDSFRPEFPVLMERISGYGTEQAADYALTFAGLVNSADNIRWLFPPEEADTLVRDTKRLIGNAAHAVGYHLAHDSHTEGEILLRSGRALPVLFEDKEPLFLLNDLLQAYQMAGEVMQDTVGTVPSVVGEGFAIHRFIDPKGTIPPVSSIYIRRLGDEVFDPNYEYGRRQSGVEACVSFNTDVEGLAGYVAGDPARLMSLDKAARIDSGAISLRLDREGLAPEDYHRDDIPRDPRQERGTLSHDVDSVFSRVGLLLAWGDQLHKQALGEESHLNHLPHFSDHMGTAQGFAALADGIKEQVDAKRLSKAQVATINRTPGRHEAAQPGTFPMFELGDEPYDLGNGAVREVASLSGVELPPRVDDESIQLLFKTWGKDFRYAYNLQRFREQLSDAGVGKLVGLIERTGITQTMPLRTIHGPVDVGDIDNAVLLEGTAGWMSKRAEVIKTLNRQHRIGAVELGATDRILDTPNELRSPNVIALTKQLGRQPTALDYMRQVIRPQLQAEGLRVEDVVGITLQKEEGGVMKRSTAEDNIKAVLAEYPQILGGFILKAENAPAGGMFAPPLLALRQVASDFDPGQYLFATDGMPLAHTPRQLDNPYRFQNPYTAASSLVRWIQAVHLINQIFAA
jgi:hypothetical protein